MTNIFCIIVFQCNSALLIAGPFKALESVQDKDKKEEETEFQQQRQATIAEVQRAKEESGHRIRSMVGSKQVCYRTIT